MSKNVRARVIMVTEAASPEANEILVGYTDGYPEIIDIIGLLPDNLFELNQIVKNSGLDIVLRNITVPLSPSMREYIFPAAARVIVIYENEE